MIKYTIIMNDNGREATAYIETKRPLVGDEPVIKERFNALEELTQPVSDYDNALIEYLRRQYERS